MCISPDLSRVPQASPIKKTDSFNIEELDQQMVFWMDESGKYTKINRRGTQMLRKIFQKDISEGVKSHNTEKSIPKI